ncbi:MAG: Unknown protein [uncultured Sulfurovum sp.]|uniref:FUN14 family protein n=1 Tax=uncultured Sulfurovum sp. TaxID=269237 RepID=A0A6S6S8E8_9BACT|nr:MAG: Unknown protein [uncultured Sulfurovum sp.]
MTQEEYSDKINQVNHLGQSGNQKMDYNNYTEPSLYENSSTAESPLPYLEMGTGFIIGLAVGFFIKKSFKAVLFILGFALIVSFYMESQGIFTINQEVLEQNIEAGSAYMEYLFDAIKERLTSFQSGIGAGAGFLVGLKIG